ncbi:DUF4123 domain-containing protein [Billgrantia antri]|uniref:DUF4123 domain-containing protein n=1 Tax=Billgrantia antri TaxID=2846777 RepID=UPI003B21F023
MPGWLNRIGERSHPVESPAAGFDGRRPLYAVLDQRRAPERCAALVGQPGWNDFLTLFAGTPLAPLLDASPWLVELTPGSEAWQAIRSLCTGQRFGWAFQPTQATSPDDLADHLRRLFVLDDPHGGQSLVNLQDGAGWTALLAAASDTAYAQLIGPLGQVVTPTPLPHWQAWHLVDVASETTGDTVNESKEPPLTQALEQALKESPRAWWLSRATETPLSALPPAWLERLGQIEAAGIKQAHYLQRLLPLICQESESFSSSVEQELRADLPMRKKVQALESLV